MRKIVTGEKPSPPLYGRSAIPPTSLDCPGLLGRLVATAKTAEQVSRVVREMRLCQTGPVEQREEGTPPRIIRVCGLEARVDRIPDTVCQDDPNLAGLVAAQQEALTAHRCKVSNEIPHESNQ